MRKWRVLIEFGLIYQLDINTLNGAWSSTAYNFYHLNPYSYSCTKLNQMHMVNELVNNKNLYNEQEAIWDLNPFLMSTVLFASKTDTVASVA